MEITEKWLSEIGGWQAMKSARGLVAAGQVSEVNREGDCVQGQVGAGRTRFASGLRIRSKSDVDNLCTCMLSRRSGQMCDHSIAVGLASLQPPPSRLPTVPASGKSSTPSPSSEPSQTKPPITPRIMPTANGELSIYLPENIFIAAASRRPLMIFLKLEPGGAGETSPLTAWLAQRQLPLQTCPLQLPLNELSGLLDSLDDHPRVYLGKPGKNQHSVLNVSTKDFRPELEVRAGSHPGTVAVTCLESPPPVPLFTEGQGWLYHTAQNTIHHWSIGATIDQTKLEKLIGATAKNPIEIKLSELAVLRTQLSDLVQWRLEGNLQTKFYTLPAPARFDLEIEGHLEAIKVTPWANCQRNRWRAGLELPKSTSGTVFFPINDELNPYCFYLRNVTAENTLIGKLMDVGFQFNGRSGDLELNGGEAVARFIASTLPKLETECHIINGPAWTRATGQLLRVVPTLRNNGQTEAEDLVNSRAGNDWLAMEFAYEAADGFRLSRADALRLVRSGQSTHKTVKGKRYVVDLAAIEALEASLQDVPAQLSAHGFKVDSVYSDYFMPFTQRSALATTQDQAVDPHSVRASLPGLGDLLRDYQVEGVAWLGQRLQAGQGAILADDMGLGKTLQSIAAIRLLRRDGQSTKPTLIVCPKSLIFNWAAEFARFSPDLVIATIHGSDRQESLKSADSIDVLITSYQLIQRDLDWYVSRHFNLIVIDEASFIRNPDTEAAKALRSLKADARLALTGTPVENGVRDLWSIYQFVLPGYLGSREQFKERFEKPLQSGGPTSPEAQNAADRLRRLVRPFFLRRTKSQVLKDLPEKIEQVLWCDMSDPQKEIYRRLLEEGRDEIRQAQKKSGAGGARMTMLTVLLRLRQACCDLRLTGIDASLIKRLALDDLSGKWPMLQERLDAMLESGRKVLIFSQFVQYLQHAKVVLEQKQIAYCYLDGSTQDRGAEVERFQTRPEKRVFLISLKAGGYGLNLTAADQVILLDPWWNPAVESQAIDRAHRFGQTQTVNAYRLVMRGTVEERILALQAKKRGLIEATIEERAPLMGGLTESDLQDLLS